MCVCDHCGWRERGREWRGYVGHIYVTVDLTLPLCLSADDPIACARACVHLQAAVTKYLDSIIKNYAGALAVTLVGVTTPPPPLPLIGCSLSRWHGWSVGTENTISATVATHQRSSLRRGGKYISIETDCKLNVDDGPVCIQFKQTGAISIFFLHESTVTSEFLLGTGTYQPPISKTPTPKKKLDCFNIVPWICFCNLESWYMLRFDNREYVHGAGVNVPWSRRSFGIHLLCTDVTDVFKIK